MNYLNEAKNFLKHYKDLKIASNNLQDKITELGFVLEGCKPVNTSGMPGGGGGSAPDDSICNAIFERDRCIDALQETTFKLLRADKILRNLENEEYNILIQSFVENSEKSDTEIAAELKMGRTSLTQKRSKALKKFSIQLFGIKAL